MNILVAEENPLTRNLLADTLQQWGHSVEQCSNGYEVWDALLRDDPPQIALFSKNLSGIGGDEICKRRSESAVANNSYLVMMVPKDRQEYGIEALAAGADDFVCKPLILGELQARLHAATRIVGMNVDRVGRETAHYVAQLEQAVDELQESRSRIVAFQESVRSDIASDLHGHVQTEMSLLYFRLLDLKDDVEPASTEAAGKLEKVAEELDNLRENAVRKLSHRLYPSKVRLGLIAGLRSLQERHANSVTLTLDIAEELHDMEPAGESQIPYDARLAVYRIAEEATLNTVKHADAAKVIIRLWLTGEGEELAIAIEDDGRGFDPESESVGLGIATMKDYMGAIRGAFHLDSSPGKGTTITATVPLSLRH